MTACRSLSCAIYTRVSSDQGLEQDFNSLDAQREAGEAFVKSQAHEGWRLHRGHYDDGGYSGGSMERPALKSLLTEVALGRIDVVVVYKVDRLTRSLADFAKLVELFDAAKVSFVSVTQSFNTTTSMGRLTLNVLLSFAQFEREVTGERIRDKIAASKKKGIWMGGVVPLGYRVENRKLLVDEAEAATVRLIFQRYLDLGSLTALRRDLRDRGILTRPRLLASGTKTGGVPLTNGPLSYMLRNRHYLGEINHRRSSYEGEHQPIIDVEQFAAVQGLLAINLRNADVRKTRTRAMLEGRLFDAQGIRMTPTHTNKGGIRYRYYVTTATGHGGKADATTIRRMPAPDVEACVIAGLRASMVDRGDDASALNQGAALPAFFEEIDLRVIAHGETLELVWRRAAVQQALASPREDREAPAPTYVGTDDWDAAAEPQRVVVPFVAIPHKRHRSIIMPEASSGTIRPIAHQEQQNLLRSIAQGRAWLKMIMAGTTTHVLAARAGKTERTIRLTVSLAFLDPKLVQAAVQGRLPRGVNATRLSDAPASWRDQWAAIGLSRPA